MAYKAYITHALSVLSSLPTLGGIMKDGRHMASMGVWGQSP